ncbi:MAG: 4-(cytidine 5'-diphospho)-2-C-methyl-D-erythritol kinase [Microcoleus sp. SU_5_3]|nr:4-(cytidine 5'-diphospho)-2-C-methyl-D-erythritol kinase [Microcoleus sp. SU_5_3]
MRSYSLQASAKINLYLEIIGDRPDGYHELAMVLQSIDLVDRIDLRPIGTDTIRVRCDHPQVPPDKNNLAYRAADLLVKQFPDALAKYGGVEISIHKQIPVAAGLAGGSANAAAVLVGMDLLWQLGLTQSELQELGGALGSDVPFCIAGGTALATGRGDELSPLADLGSFCVVLAKYRNVSISTAWAYQTYRQQFGSSYCAPEDLDCRRERLHSGPMVGQLPKDRSKIGKLLHNDLEKVALPVYPQVLQLREAFESAGVLGTMMSGSGPTVFALAESRAQAEEVRDRVKSAIASPDLDFWVANFSNTGIRIVSDGNEMKPQINADQRR